MPARAVALLAMLLAASAAGAATKLTGGTAGTSSDHASSHVATDEGSSIFDRWGNLLTRTDCTRAGGSWNAGKRSCGPKTR